MGTLNVDCGLL